MDRRLLITAVACWPAARLLAQDGAAQPRHRISAARLHESLSARFPVRFGIGGLFEVQVSAPGLLLLPVRQQLGATLAAQLGGATVQELQAGEMDVVFALRYEPSDRTVRAHQLEILEVRWPGLSADAARLLRGTLPRLARDAVGEIVLHAFSPRELAVADTMGFEPEKIEVAHDGVVILFGPKPR